MEQRAVDAKLVEIVPFVKKANSRMMGLKVSLKRIATEDLCHTHNATGFEEFIVGDSWVSMLVQKSVCLIFEDDETFETIELKANDIDVYYGQFADEDGGDLKVFLEWY